MTKFQSAVGILALVTVIHSFSVVHGMHGVPSVVDLEASSLLPPKNGSGSFPSAVHNGTLDLSGSNTTVPFNNTRPRRDLMDKLLNSGFWNSPSRYELKHATGNSSIISPSNSTSNTSSPLTLTNHTMVLFSLNRTSRGLLDSLFNSAMINSSNVSANGSQPRSMSDNMNMNEVNRTRRGLMDMISNSTISSGSNSSSNASTPLAPTNYTMLDRLSRDVMDTMMNSSAVTLSNSNATLPRSSLNSTAEMVQLNRTRRGLMDTLFNSTALNDFFGGYLNASLSPVLNISALGKPAYSGSIMNESLVMYPVKFTAPSSALLRQKRHGIRIPENKSSGSQNASKEEDLNILLSVVDDPMAIQNINMNGSSSNSSLGTKPSSQVPVKHLAHPLSHMSSHAAQPIGPIGLGAKPNKPKQDSENVRPARAMADETRQQSVSPAVQSATNPEMPSVANLGIQPMISPGLDQLANQGLKALSSYLPMYNMTMDQRFERVKGFGDSIQNLGGSIQLLSASLRNVTSFLFGGDVMKTSNQFGQQPLN